MTTELATQDVGTLVEQVVVQGDLSKLGAADRVRYYKAVCESVGLNPLTKPFEYITLSGKLTLYARRDATDQLRKLHHVSVAISARERMEDLYVVTAKATNDKGRVDESIGAVSLQGLKGEALANAIMKAETKAKRRVTLSICGLGLLDETEVETIPDAVVGEPAPAKPRAVPKDPPRVDLTTGEVLEPPPADGDPIEADVMDLIARLDAAPDEKTVKSVWAMAGKREFWYQLTTSQQNRLVAAKDRAKQRLGVA